MLLNAALFYTVVQFSTANAVEQPQQAKISWARAFKGWDNKTCAKGKGDTANYWNCIQLLGVLAQTASKGEVYFIHHSQMSAEWEIIRDKRGSELIDPDFLLVKETELRKRRLYHLMITSGRQASVEQKMELLTVAAVRKLRKPPEVDFELLRKIIVSQFSDPEGEDGLALDFLVNWTRLHDPFAWIAKGDVEVHTGESGPVSVGIVSNDKDVLISRVVPNSVLDKAGVACGDRILKINGSPATPQSLYDLTRKVSLPIAFSVENDQREVKEFTINSEQKDNPALVKSYIIESGDKKVGVIAFWSFMSSGLCEKVGAEIDSLKEADVQALVYDLRGNRGGLLNQVNCIMGFHVGKDKRIAREVLLKDTQVYPDIKSDYPAVSFATTTSEQKTDLPLTVLIDVGRASASEMLAGIVKQQEKGWIVGQRSRGKGVSQSGFPTPWGDDVTSYRTVHRFEFMDGGSIHGHGVTPDFEVASATPGVDGEKFAWRVEDEYGSQFAGKPEGKPSARRIAARHGVERCVAASRLNADDKTGRWLRDLQLKKAIEVSMCEVEIAEAKKPKPAADSDTAKADASKTKVTKDKATKSSKDKTTKDKTSKDKTTKSKTAKEKPATKPAKKPAAKQKKQPANAD